MKNGLGWLALPSLLMLGITHAQTNKVTYVYTDFQGTPLAEADANGNITATFDYKPYGSQALGTPSTGPAYTGHVSDSDTGLIYMQARYYDADVARFLSIDPVTPVAGNAFNLNRYTYANNNPIVNMDPDGRNSIIVLNGDGSININIPVNFTGPAATAQNINSIKADAASRWSGLYNISGQIAKVSVAIVDVNSNTPKKAVNNITLLNGPTSDKISQGASFVRGGNSGEWDMTSNGMKVGESAHETGHLMGDKDYYKSGTDANGARFTNPLPGYSNNLMGALNATTMTDSRNMDLILSSPKNTVEYTPPPPPPPPQL
jgi:RHS repeat-associated protein